jgi:hypothetical protein
VGEKNAKNHSSLIKIAANLQKTNRDETFFSPRVESILLNHSPASNILRDEKGNIKKSLLPSTSPKAFNFGTAKFI